MGDCKNCKHGVVIHGRKNVHCTCEPIRKYIYTGDDLICKEYAKKESAKNDANQKRGH